MCGIFGALMLNGNVALADLRALAEHAQQRGRDSSGLLVYRASSGYEIHRAERPITWLLKRTVVRDACFVSGHSRLITNGNGDNQPVLREGVVVFHNGIVVNDSDLWERTGLERRLEIDSEILAALVARATKNGQDIKEIPRLIVDQCKGIVAAAIALPEAGKLVLFSNNGSLYVGEKNGAVYFASERFALDSLNCELIEQVRESRIFDIPKRGNVSVARDEKSQRINLVPALPKRSSEEHLLQYQEYRGQRCSRCVLPDTMPFIEFDDYGVCNYCRNYVKRNLSRPVTEIMRLVEPYRRANGPECIVPFSGGRDSCFGLHLVVKELGLRAIAYTYDWGMVTDLGRRNISRFCSELGVENIIVAADIQKKRVNIAKNLKAWLKAPDLGMVSILTAGDKHFFRHIETVKRQTRVQLNLWGVNPLEVTHFKAGFLGVPPDFSEKMVYANGFLKQLRYHALRTRAMMRSIGYFNSSLWDTLYGEFYRSFTTKEDYFHLFDYWQWNEHEVDETLKKYDWERAVDTKTTWRIGDGTAAFYNYIYQRVVGFTEHDTFRSNQIREGQITRQTALELVEDENRPRYQNIKWYLDAVGLDYTDVITTINKIPFGSIRSRSTY